MGKPGRTKGQKTGTREERLRELILTVEKLRKWQKDTKQPHLLYKARHELICEYDDEICELAAQIAKNS